MVYYDSGYHFDRYQTSKNRYIDIASRDSVFAGSGLQVFEKPDSCKPAKKPEIPAKNPAKHDFIDLVISKSLRVIK